MTPVGEDGLLDNVSVSNPCPAVAYFTLIVQVPPGAIGALVQVLFCVKLLLLPLPS